MEPSEQSFVEPIALLRWFSDRDESHVRVRAVLLRLLALVYLVAFVVTIRQFRPLIGARGLEPAQLVLDRVHASMGTTFRAFLRLPTVFWFGCSDGAIATVGWLGIGTSLLALAGATNAILQLVMWALYLSIAQIGGRFYGYGWESQLCEAGFLAIFLCPVRTVLPSRAPAPPKIVILLFRFLIARIMLGAGLIKIRGDACWRDLTCLVTHYETQPNPTPLARLLHAAPHWFHQCGVLFNHFVELVLPFFAFGPRRARLTAGVLFIVFQVFLIASGNLSFLNWLTIVPALACFDDRFLRAKPTVVAPSGRHVVGASVMALGVGFLSIQPVANLFASDQAMNRTYDPFRLVNTYGAFGSVNRERYEIVLEGTADDEPKDDARWLEYELPCKPGDPMRTPCVITPYHLRLDWQLWFCSFRDLDHEPWLAHLAYKLLRGDPIVRPLFARDPFPASPPKWIRARVFWYRFTRPGEQAWWRRSPVGEYLRPVRVDDPDLLFFLKANGLKQFE